MPICIECSYPVSHLYTSYSKADDHSLGKGVRLTQCPRCKRFADKYVEHDFVVLFIDLVLIKPQVYRHLLFNRLGRDDNKFDRSIIRLGILLLLFDVYLTWARIERSSSLSSTPLSTAPIVVQYLFFLTLNAVATLVHHLTVRFLASMMVPKPPPSPVPNGDASSHNLNEKTMSPASPSVPASSTDNNTPAPATTANSSSSSGNPVRSPSAQDTSGNGGSAQRPPAPVPPGGIPPPLRRVSTSPQMIQPLPPPSPASPSMISTALLVSSCPKLFPILLVIWGPEGTSDVPDTGSTETNSPAATMLLQKTVEVLSTASSSSPTSTATAAAAAATSTCSLPPCPSPSTSTSALSFFSSFSTAFASNTTSGAGWNPLHSIFQSLLSLLSLSAADTHLVLLNNIEALFILLDCGYLRAVALAVAGQAARWAVEKIVLGVVEVG